jgi:HAMP domain-containing protein
MTGLLYLIVIVMWAVVLLPIWLKRHDQKLVKNELIEAEVIQHTWRWQQREPMSARQLGFVRRRRVAMVIASALVATLVLGAAGKISMFWIVVPILLAAVFGFAAAQNANKTVRRVRANNSQNDSTPLTKPAAPVQATEIVALSKTVTETTRKWQPIETPMPSYVNAAKATQYARVLDSQKPWTGQDMIEQAELLRTQRAARIQESQKRLEEARAIAMEKARKAAIAAAQTYPDVATKRAVNE